MEETLRRFEYELKDGWEEVVEEVITDEDVTLYLTKARSLEDGKMCNNNDKPVDSVYSYTRAIWKEKKMTLNEFLFRMLPTTSGVLLANLIVLLIKEWRNS